MFWLRRPPYLRWAAAVGIVLAALAWDLRGSGSEPFPFAATDIGRGDRIDEAAVEWRSVPPGLLEVPDLSLAFAAYRVERGDPITASAVSREPAVPDGWWAFAVTLPAAAYRGSRVRIVVAEPPLSVEGIVVAISEHDPLSLSDAGLVAVPGLHAETLALAAGQNAISVLVQP